MLAKLLKDWRQLQLARQVKVSQRELILNLLEFVLRDSLVVGAQGLPYALTVNVVADPKLLAPFPERSHSSVPFPAPGGPASILLDALSVVIPSR